jgi:hypothetical protein
LVVRYEYPAENGLPKPLQLTWYHGGKKPAVLPPAQTEKWPSGVLFIGEKGMLLADYTRHVVLRDANFADYAEPTAINSDFTEHHQDWLRAIKTDRPAASDFAYSGPLTEAALLGNVAFRAGCKIEWDATNLSAKNCPAAGEFIQHHYRPGWRL